MKSTVTVRTNASLDLIDHHLTDANLHSVEVAQVEPGVVRFTAAWDYPLRRALEVNLFSRITVLPVP